VQADGQALRFTLDGATPTTALGFLIPAGTSITLMATAVVSLTVPAGCNQAVVQR
jgi:hypothetical protein